MVSASNQAFLPLDGADGAADRLAWRRLHELGRTRQFPAGHRVVRSDRTSPFIHVVITGFLVGEDVTPDGREVALALLWRGALFGEAALMQGRLDSEREGAPAVRTVTAARVLSIRAVELQEALRGDENLRRWLHARLVERIRRAEAMLVRSRAGSVGDRVEALLCDLARSGPRTTSLAARTFTQETLARLVGSTRESVNRAIASLVRDGRLVRVGRGYAVPVTSSPEAWPVRTGPPRVVPRAGPALRPPA